MDKTWGHCRHCRFFNSPALVPLGEEEAACREPTLASFQLRVFGASGCNAFELREGIAAAEQQPGMAT